MAVAQHNIRMDEGLKLQGDATLARFGASAFDAVSGKGLALGLANQKGLRCDVNQISYAGLRELAFEEMLEEGRYRA